MFSVYMHVFCCGPTSVDISVFKSSVPTKIIVHESFRVIYIADFLIQSSACIYKVSQGYRQLKRLLYITRKYVYTGVNNVSL